MSRRHRVRRRQEAAFPQMRVDRALRRIARFSNPNTWHPNLQRQFVEMMARRFGRTIEIVPRETPAGGVVPSILGARQRRAKEATASAAFKAEAAKFVRAEAPLAIDLRQ